MRSMVSNSILAGYIPAIRMSGRRYANNCNICATKAFWNLYLAATIVCDHKELFMAWFLNMYRCERCEKVWRVEWSCTCEDDCPHCGLRHMTPFQSEDLTDVIAP